jgi:hypothetical protein
LEPAQPAHSPRDGPTQQAPARGSLWQRPITGRPARPCAPRPSARGRGSRQPGPGPSFSHPAWAKRSLVAHGSTSTVRSRSTVVRGFQRNKNPFASRSVNPSSFSPPIPPALSSPPERARERRRPAARSERRHGEPPRRRVRPPQGERAAVERHHRGAQIYGAASSPAAARPASVHAGPKASWDRVDTPASRAR